MATLSENNLVGAAGEYFVCAELCKRGFLALLTPKNNPIFDVVATNTDGSKSVSIQVKTRSVRNKQGWKFGVDMGTAKAQSNLYVVLVNLKDNGSPSFYIYEYSVLIQRVAEVYKKYITNKKKDGTARKEVGFRWLNESSFTDEDKLRIDNWAPIINALR